MVGYVWLYARNQWCLHGLTEPECCSYHTNICYLMIGSSQVLKAGLFFRGGALTYSTTHLLLAKAFFRIFFAYPITSQDLSLILKLDISDIVVVD